MGAAEVRHDGQAKAGSHTLTTLTGAMSVGTALGLGAVWSTFYDMRRYGGLQIFLLAMLGGGQIAKDRPSSRLLTGNHGGARGNQRL